MSENPLVLVLNCGSSSIKFAIIQVNSEQTLLSGLAERLNNADAELRYQDHQGKHRGHLEGQDHQAAIQAIVKLTQQSGYLEQLVAIGHRVVHGGEYFQQSCLINDQHLEWIRACIPLAPLHNPAHVLGIEMARAAFASLPQVAVFDTSFHQTMPARAFVYPLPYALYQEQGIRRYGFHGTSHRFVSRKAAHLLDLDYHKSAFICAHLGNGCSVSAILNGASVDTSMGFTPLEGLMMGTRCGDIDPSIHAYLGSQLGWDLPRINRVLNQESGLLGISGLSNDMRSLIDAAQQGHERAALAIELFCYRLAKYIAALTVPLGRLDALLFTGGIGENASLIRAKVLNQLGILGLSLDEAANRNHGQDQQGRISQSSHPAALVVATNEELLIAQDALLLI